MTRLLFDPITEGAKRDAALDLLEAHRSAVIERARSVTYEIAERRGSVTSPEVLAVLRDQGVDTSGHDPRFMGAVFRYGWERVGYQPWGSHKRPVSVWKLKTKEGA